MEHLPCIINHVPQRSLCIALLTKRLLDDDAQFSTAMARVKIDEVDNAYDLFSLVFDDEPHRFL